MSTWLGAGAESPEHPAQFQEAVDARAAEEEAPPVDAITAALIPTGGGPADVVVLYGYLWRARTRAATKELEKAAKAAAGAAKEARRLAAEAKPKDLGKRVEEEDKAFEAEREARRQAEVRLYTTWLLDEYIDLTGVQIKYWRKIPYDGGTLVWVSRDHPLPRVQVPQPNSVPSSFLGGTIAHTYLSGAPSDAWRDPSGATLVPESAPCHTPAHGCGFPPG
jgi:hypothetical protein